MPGEPTSREAPERIIQCAAELQATERDIGEGLTAALWDLRHDVTCHVGTNESGKTAFLRVLSRLNPAHESGSKFVPSPH